MCAAWLLHVRLSVRSICGTSQVCLFLAPSLSLSLSIYIYIYRPLFLCISIYANMSISPGYKDESVSI